MFEIEMKAHVRNRNEVREKLNSLAEFCGRTYKNDVYYEIPAGDGTGADGFISARIRTETGTDGRTEIFLTYKRKQLLEADGGAAIEVNDEKECMISDAAPLEAMLADAGARISLRKEKDAYHWKAETEAGTVHIELCAVPPLGDFLEIETISPENGAGTVEKIKSAEKALFTACGIPDSDLEPRYYRDMLAEHGDAALK